jgi:branched-chain amino acid aminotransferase
MKKNAVKALIDDELVNLSHATIALSDQNYAYGIGVYETLRQRGGRRYFTRMHIERLFASARIIGITAEICPEDILRRLDLVRDANPVADMNIKVMLIKDDNSGCRCYILPAEIPRVAGNRDLEFPEPVGVDLFEYRGERHFPQAKSLSMLLSSVALSAAKAQNCWDALLVDRDGMLLEGSRSNLFWVEGDRLCSPPEERILAGVTRANIIRCALEIGFEFEIAELRLDEMLARPRPLIVSSTSIALQPVKHLFLADGRKLALPESPLVDRLSRAYGQYLHTQAETD